MSIFISYSHDDRPIVHETIGLLELAFPDTKVFWDKQLVGGDLTADKLSEEVRWCQAFVFFASDNSMSESSYCQYEIRWAKYYGRHIVPYCISISPEEVVEHLGGDNIFCIDARMQSKESFARLCGSIFRVVTPHSEVYRKQMFLLFNILNRLEDHDAYLEAVEAFEGGYELNYAWQFYFDPPMSEKDCKEVLDILSMLERLQYDWMQLQDEDKSAVITQVESAEFTIMNVGFWANEEGRQFGYLCHLRKHKRFEHLILANNSGNTHGIQNLPRYRMMLTRFNQLKSDQESNLSSIRRCLEPGEFIRILAG